MRTRLASNERLPALHAVTAQPMPANTATAAMPGHSQRRHGARWADVRRTWSWAEVSRIMIGWLDGVTAIKQNLCQLPSG
ncbi:hypothetical protein N8D55_19520 [Xanthomonas hortorum pv. pelargonii]|nr:hypothetical protein N8D55_19520 [Xanthomonas hortorum pv. pelargonii]